MTLNDALRNSTLLLPHKTSWFSRNKRFTLIVLAIAIVLPIFSLIIVFLPIIINFLAEDKGALHKFIERVGWPAQVVVGILYASFSVLLVPAPILALGVAVINSSKIWVALVTGYVGGLVGACAAFVIGRKLHHRIAYFERLSETSKFLEVDVVMNSGSPQYWVVILLRTSPWMGCCALNYALSLTSVGYRQYFIGTLIGLIPYNFLSVYLAWASVHAITSTYIHNLFKNIYINGTVASVSIGIVIFLSTYARHKLAQKLTSTAKENVSINTSSSSEMLRPPSLGEIAADDTTEHEDDGAFLGDGQSMRNSYILARSG